MFNYMKLSGAKMSVILPKKQNKNKKLTLLSKTVIKHFTLSWHSNQSSFFFFLLSQLKCYVTQYVLKLYLK